MAYDNSIVYWKGRDGSLDSAKGENHPSSKLTEDQVRDILSRPKTGPDRQFSKDIAKEFGVSKNTVSDIRCGRRWMHIQRELNA